MKRTLPASFVDFLKEEFLSGYLGVKDTFEDDFDGWLEELDGEDYIMYGERLYNLLMK